jgi:hypothetical protein
MRCPIRASPVLRVARWQSAWTRESESALVAAIGEAERHALDKDAFLGPLRQAPPARLMTPP